MSNLNKVLLMGRLTRDPELRYTPQQTPVCEIGIAVNREYSTGSERRKETTFVDVTLWKRQAEVVCQYMRKGSPIFIEGRLSLDSWETPDGQKRSRLRVVAENFQFVGSRQDSDASGGSYQGGGGPAYPERQRAPQAQAGPTYERPPAGSDGPPPDEGNHLGVDDSDVPF